MNLSFAIFLLFINFSETFLVIACQQKIRVKRFSIGSCDVRLYNFTIIGEKIGHREGEKVNTVTTRSLEKITPKLSQKTENSQQKN